MRSTVDYMKDSHLLGVVKITYTFSLFSKRSRQLLYVLRIAKMPGSGRVELVMLSADSKNICVA